MGGWSGLLEKRYAETHALSASLAQELCQKIALFQWPLYFPWRCGVSCPFINFGGILSSTFSTLGSADPLLLCARSQMRCTILGGQGPGCGGFDTVKIRGQSSSEHLRKVMLRPQVGFRPCSNSCAFPAARGEAASPRIHKIRKGFRVCICPRVGVELIATQNWKKRCSRVQLLFLSRTR